MLDAVDVLCTHSPTVTWGGADLSVEGSQALNCAVCGKGHGGHVLQQHMERTEINAHGASATRKVLEANRTLTIVNYRAHLVADCFSGTVVQ